MKSFNCEFYIVKNANEEIWAPSEGPAIEKFKRQLVAVHGFSDEDISKGQLQVRFAGADCEPVEEVKP